MTKDELLEALALIVEANAKNPQNAARLIWDLYADHASYAVVAGKILHRASGEELR